MGIPVKCPNGHEFKVKDKYAGKKGLCPYCVGEVKVKVPDATDSDQLAKSAYRAVAAEHGGATPSAAAAAAAAAAGGSVLDDSHDNLPTDSSASGSMLGSSVIRHNIRCKCGESVPMWFAKCPKCGFYFDHR